MGRKYDVKEYMQTCDDGDEMLAFCKEHHINTYADLMNNSESFPDDKREMWVKHLCSTGFIRFLASRGIR